MCNGQLLKQQDLSKDIVAYWCSLFPEQNCASAVENILQSVSDCKFDDLLEEYFNVNQPLLDTLNWHIGEHEAFFTQILQAVEGEVPWVSLYKPILGKYITTLIEVVNHSEIVLEPLEFLYHIVRDVCGQLHLISFQSVVAETYLAKVEGKLIGNNRDERGSYFNHVLLKDQKFVHAFYENYYELLRLLDLKIYNSICFAISILEETEANLKTIQTRIASGRDLDRLRYISMSEGDTHNGGKSVVKLNFDKGGVVIYKPHNLLLEEKFYHFIDWLNEEIIDQGALYLKAAKCYNAGNSGWMEFVEHKACASQKEVEVFYKKIGILLCILHISNGIDIHYENLIAHGSDPVLIDLETFIHPQILSEFGAGETALEVAMRQINDSVHKIALLPTYVINEKTKKVLNMGGIGAAEDQESPFTTKFIENMGTDEVRIKRLHSKIESKNNNPLFEGLNVESKRYQGFITEGFKYMYRKILNHRESYCSNFIKHFQESTLRVIFRPTNVYAQLLYCSYHPDLMTNPVDRFVFLHRLPDKPKEKYGHLSHLEIEDLLNGDIPYYSVSANQILISGNTSHRASRYITIEEPTIETCHHKILAMSEEAMFRQLAIINSKFELQHLDYATRFTLQTAQEVDRSGFVAGAEKIADFLIKKSIVGLTDGKQDRIWYGTKESEYGFQMFLPVDMSLYYGLSGIALFFNALGQNSNNEQYLKISDEICRRIVKEITVDMLTTNTSAGDLGAYSGLAGIAYALFNIDVSRGTNRFNREIHYVLERILEHAEHIEKFDVIGGAGILGVSRSIYEKTQDEQLRTKSVAVSQLIFNRLLNWINTKDKKRQGRWSDQGYIGYAHGNSGIVAQVMRWHDTFDRQSILELTQRGLAFEREYFIEGANNWKRSVGEEALSCAWCYGAPGILLSRLMLKEHGYQDAYLDDEIKKAVACISSNEFGRNWCLCHGDIGNLSVLRAAASHLKDEELQNRVLSTYNRVLSELLQCIEKDAYREVEDNGLMTGLSGVGYELLRMVFENQIPNVLGLR